jgi:Probable Zinc-ribbon domain
MEQELCNVKKFKITFDVHPKAKFWSDKNNGKKPSDYSLNSHKKCWFDCDVCGHSFDVALKLLVGRNSWCSYCVNKRICDKNKNCKICFDKSLASVEYSKYWSKSNSCETSPYEIFKNSHKQYLFDCPNCQHTFKQLISHITRGNSCSYCANRVLCDENNNCKTCFNKSFASIERSKYWSCKNKKKPIEVFKSSAEKFIFNCDNCNNVFTSKLCHVTDGSWCPNCMNKTEGILYKK